MSSINSDFGSTPHDYSSTDNENVETGASVNSGESIDSSASLTSSSDSIASSSSLSTPSSLNGIDLNGGLSYIAYLAQVSKPQLENKKVMQDSAQNDFSSDTISKFLLSILLDVQNIRQYRKQIRENGAGVEELRDQQNAQIDDFNAQRTVYNKGDGSETDGVNGENKAIDDLNSAIDQFNSGTLTETEFRAAVDAYNNYVAIRNAGAITDVNSNIDDFNAQVAANNAQIDTINAQRALLGLSPISYQTTVNNVVEMTPVDLPIGPLTPPLGNLTETRVKVPKVSNFSNPPTQADLDKLVDTMLKNTIDSSKGLGDKIGNIQSVADYIRFKVFSKRVNAPNAYIEHFNNRSPAARGGSTFGLSFFLAGSDPNLLSTLSLSNFKKQLSEFGDPIQAGDTDITANGIINKTLNGAAAASVQGFNSVQSDLGLNVAPGTPAGNLVLSLAFAQQIAQLTAGSDLEASISAGLGDDPSLANLTEGQKLEALSVAVGGIKQNLSLTALLQIAIAANLPGLVGQVLGQVSPELAKGLGGESTIAQINELLGSGAVQESLVAILQSKSGGNKSAVTTALENTLLQGAIFASPGSIAAPGTPLVGGDGAPLLGSDGKPLTIPDNGSGVAIEGGVSSRESLRNSLLGVSDALGGFSPTVQDQASSSAGSAIAGFSFTSEGQFQSQLALNLENQGINTIQARNLSVDATLALVNETAIPGIIGSALDQDIGLAGGASLGKQEVQQAILQGVDSATQLDNAISISLQKDEVDSVRQLRDEITRQLVAQNIGFDQALALANSSAQKVVEANHSDQTFTTSSLDDTAIKSALSTELTKRGILDSFAASAAADKIVSQAFNQSSAIISEAVFKEALANEMTQQGIASRETAATIADALSITHNGTPSDALRSTTGKQLTPNELANDLQTSLLAILTGQIGVEQAKKLSGALVKEVVGFEATQGEPTRNPLSLSNQIKTAIDVTVKGNAQKFDDNQTENFRTFSSPNIDLFTQTQRRLDPANSILMSGATGVMYDQSPGGSSFQTPGSSHTPNIISLAG